MLLIEAGPHLWLPSSSPGAMVFRSMHKSYYDPAMEIMGPDPHQSQCRWQGWGAHEEEG
jgi:hypothetical protein